MPIIQITQDQIDRSKPPASGWHIFKVEKFVDGDSKDKKSKNWVFECVIIKSAAGDENIGRYGFARFNSKAPGMLISSGFLPALYDRPINEEFQFDPDGMAGMEFWGEITDSIYDGKPQKKLETFSPKSAPPL